MARVRIVSAEELKENLLTNKNLYVANIKRMQIYDPLRERIADLLMLTRQKDTFCFEVVEEDENESETD